MSTFDPTDLVGQEQEKNQDAERKRLEALTDEEDTKWLMGDVRGRRVMWRILETTGLFRCSFTGDNETFFREGMRNVGLMLQARIHEHAPEAYGLMAKEQSGGSFEHGD